MPAVWPAPCPARPRLGGAPPLVSLPPPPRLLPHFTPPTLGGGGRGGLGDGRHLIGPLGGAHATICVPGMQPPLPLSASRFCPRSLATSRVVAWQAMAAAAADAPTSPAGAAREAAAASRWRSEVPVQKEKKTKNKRGRRARLTLGSPQALVGRMGKQQTAAGRCGGRRDSGDDGDRPSRGAAKEAHQPAYWPCRVHRGGSTALDQGGYSGAGRRGWVAVSLFGCVKRRRRRRQRWRQQPPRSPPRPRSPPPPPFPPRLPDLHRCVVVSSVTA